MISSVHIYQINFHDVYGMFGIRSTLIYIRAILVDENSMNISWYVAWIRFWDKIINIIFIKSNTYILYIVSVLFVFLKIVIIWVEQPRTQSEIYSSESFTPRCSYTGHVHIYTPTSAHDAWIHESAQSVNACKVDHYLRQTFRNERTPSTRTADTSRRLQHQVVRFHYKCIFEFTMYHVYKFCTKW